MNMLKNIRRGQAYSADFILSISIFVLILLMLFPIWNDLGDKIREAESRKDMQVSTMAASDLLTRSTGSPQNWSASNAMSIGLANSAHEINTTKFLRMKEIDYNSAKWLLGISYYNFSINITEQNGHPATSGISRPPAAYYSSSTSEILPMLSGSGLVWDYYWGHDLPGTEPDHGDARNFYSGSEEAMMNAMLFNATARGEYETIIIEQPSLAPALANLTALRQFVQNGGRLIFEGYGAGGEILIDDMGATPYNGAEATGTVNTSSWLLPDVIEGSVVLFTNASWSFYSAEGVEPINIIVQDIANSSRGLIADWSYGYGTIYYITDVNGTIGGEELSDLLNIAGEQLFYGEPHVNTTADIVVSTRPSVLATDGGDGNRMATMQLLVWRN